MPTAVEFFDEEETKRFQSLAVAAHDNLVYTKYSVYIHKDFLRSRTKKKSSWPPKYWQGTLEEWETQLRRASDAIDDIGTCIRPAYVFNLYYKLSTERWAVREHETTLDKVKKSLEGVTFNDETGAYEMTGETFEALQKLLKANAEFREDIAPIRAKFNVPLDSDEEKVVSSDLDSDDAPSAAPEAVV